MTQPYLLRSLLLREGMHELDQHIARTQGYGAAEGWEPQLNRTQRDSSSDWDAAGHERIQSARAAQRGTAEHWQAQQQIRKDNIRNGNG